METRILLAVHARASPLLDALFRLSHELGSVWFCTLLVAALAAWHLARGERREALAWAALGLLTLAWMEGLKALVARPRPELWPRLVVQTGYSFPSGHALASATFYPFLGWLAGRGRPLLQRAGCAAGIALAATIGLGRLYLGVHWPSDVLAGWALGATQCAAAIAWLERGTRA